MTYIAVTDVDPFLSHDEDWNSLSGTEKSRAVSFAIDALDLKPWVGSVVSVSQNFSWPRKAIVYYDPAFGTYIEIPEGAIPLRLKKAVAVLASHYSRYPEAYSAYEPVFDSITIGPISLSNNNPESEKKVPRIPRKVEELILPFLLPGSSSPSWWRAN